LIGGDVTAAGCANASLYTCFCAAGLTELNCFPQLVTVTQRFEPTRLASMEQRILAILSAEEATEWRESVARAKAEGAFFFALPYHCAVGEEAKLVRSEPAAEHALSAIDGFGCCYGAKGTRHRTENKLGGGLTRGGEYG
jgi:hypothetical protein